MLIPAIAYVVCDFESSLIPVMKETRIPPNFYKKKRLLNIVNYPPSHRSHLHTCVCAFYDIKSGNVDINSKKTTLKKIGTVVDYEELDTSNFRNLSEIPSSISSANIKQICEKLDIPLAIFELLEDFDDVKDKKIEKRESTFRLVYTTSKNIEVDTFGDDVVKLMYFSNQFYLILDLEGLMAYIDLS